MNNDHILKWLNTTKIPLSKIAKETEVSRGALYNFINGKTDLRGSTKVKLLNVFENEIRWTNNKLTIKGGIKLDNQTITSVTRDSNENEIDASYVLNLQKNEINRLNTEVSDLKNRVSQFDNYNKQSYEEITDYDTETKTQMVFRLSGVSRTMLSISKLDVFAEKLGYKLDELSCYVLFGEEFKMNEHPIEKLLHKDSIKLIDSLLESLPKAFNILKGMVGCHYIPINLSYTHKKGHLVHTMNYCSVNWSTKVVSTKTKFLS